MKEELKRLKAGLLLVILSLTLNGCSNNKEEQIENIKEEQIEQIDESMYLVAFIEDKAIIYTEEDSGILLDRGAGSVKVYNGSYYTYFVQIPTINIRGKENAIKFASQIVKEENVLFMSFTEDKNKELILTPNN